MQPSIWNLTTGSKVWQGKGGKPNRVGLVDKPYTTALAFLPGSGTAANGSSNESAAAGTSGEDGAGISLRFIAGSATAKLHVYDTAAGKRPQQQAVFGESRVTAVAVDPEGEPWRPLGGWEAVKDGVVLLHVCRSSTLQPGSSPCLL
jgi:ribosome biogenesis protein NSA1